MYCRIIISALLCVLSSIASARDLPRRPQFGAQLSPVTDSVRTATGQSFEGGLQLGQITPNSSAEAAGLLPGDILISLDNKSPASVPDLVAQLKAIGGGKSVDMEYVRGTERIPGEILLKEYPRETPEDFDVLYEAVDVDGALRRVIFTKPRTEGKLPMVVLMGGLGCYSVDVPPPTPFSYREILYALTRAGFVTMRIEKTGMGDSEGAPCAEQSFFDEVHGLVCAVHEASRFSFVDTSRIIYLGHSMGGLVAPVVYQDVPCAGICAIGTGGISWFEYELTNQRRQMVLGGADYDSLEMQQAEKELAMHLLYVEKQTPEQILAEHPTFTDYINYPAHYTFMQEVANLNLAHYWKTVDSPVLLIHGGADFISDGYEHAYCRDIINYYHPGRAEYLEFPEMDHYFLKAKDQTDAFAQLVAGFPNSEMNQGIFDPIIAFCKKCAGI
jgi:alpha-beta hydrolase superfamily lysophospholipase